MNDIQKFKEFLGPAAKGYSDRELPQLRREMQAMAELLLDIYVRRKAQSKARTQGVFDRASANS